MTIGAVGHIKVFRITLKSGAGKSSLASAQRDGIGGVCLLLNYDTHAGRRFDEESV